MMQTKMIMIGGVTLTKEDDLFHESIQKVVPVFRDKCPICQERYSEHNYHGFVSCLEILTQVSRVMRHGRDGY